jgi:DNA processing protein
VGSRRPSALGIESARTLAHGLARAGVIVVSGGAIGIDARAHDGALDVGAPTIAVLGSGIDVEYPSTNRELLREIARQGTLVSEYPPGAPALPYRFPARNRVIAGLCVGVVVVEGVAKSGTRSTADYATQIGAEVFAVPGPVTSPLSDAPHELIRDGARLIRGVDDLLADLHIEPGSVPVSLDGLPADEQAVFQALAEPLLLEAAADASGLSIGETLTALMQLEIKALVHGGGGRYRRAIPPRRPEDVQTPPRPRASGPNASEAHGGSM